MRLVIPDPSDLDTETDEDLLLAIVAGDPDECHLAANAFFRRHVRPLYYFCRRFRSTLGDDGDVEYLVLRTFQRAFEGAESYNGVGVTDKAKSRARTFRWLSTIAAHLFQDWLKSPDEATPIQLADVGRKSGDGAVHGSQVDLDDHLLVVPDGSDGPPPPDPESPEMRCLREALDALPEREREVLLLGAMYGVPGKQLRIPEGVLDELCLRWHTSRENIRAIRTRALKKVKARVDPSRPSI
ncbi:MAG TPA: sigma-70 family RNA polymerase sigma factor [Rubricoccaceae bacterium]|jgi:DNA-directed RNA polymerase specialized sigma24 family protein